MRGGYGRPLKFETAAELRCAAEEYLQGCALRGERPTVTGLGRALGGNHMTVSRYAKKAGFARVVEEVKKKIRDAGREKTPQAGGRAHLMITDKDARVTPLCLNGPQQKLMALLDEQKKQGRPQRVIILKARQMGFSTAVESILFERAVTEENINCGIIAHKRDATDNLFKMSQRYYTYLPEAMKPEKKPVGGAKALVFPNKNSAIRCMTAGGKGIGRSDTYHMLHISEFAYWPGDKKETVTGLLQAVPATPDSLVVIESTANGYDYFKDMWDKAVAGESSFAPLFCAWHELPGYCMKYDGFALTKREKKLKEDYKLTNGQIAWRRWCLSNNCGGDESRFRQEYPSNPYEAFLASGRSVFQKERVMERLAHVLPPVKTGWFAYTFDGKIKDVRWEEGEGGFIKVYSEPKAGVPYVIGGDTAGDGSDSFTGQVLDNMTGEQVATLKHKFDEDLYARQMYCLGKYYNNALIGIEANFSTYPIRELKRLGYFHQYERERLDEYTGRTEKRYGFKTTSATRPVLISGLVKLAREQPELINDRDTLLEMLTFVRNERGRPQAMAGKHDDCVMGLAIAHEIRTQQRMTASARKPKRQDDREMEEMIGWGT